ncbi:MAG: hypothetical protein H6824_22775 [Planctomycetaceae bacterium]|nr:hypothetical protein [Planctomycetaceae bacterium]
MLRYAIPLAIMVAFALEEASGADIADSESNVSCEFLQQVSDELVETRKSIHQWVGTAVLTEEFRSNGGKIGKADGSAVVLEGPVLNSRTIDLKFRVDDDAGHEFTEYFSRSPAIITSIATGEEYAVEENIVQWNLTRNEEGLYVKRPGEKVGELTEYPSGRSPFTAESTSLIVRRPLPQVGKTTLGASEFHPEVVFVDGGRDAAEVLQRYCRQFCNESPLVNVKATVEGTIVVTKRYNTDDPNGGVVHQVTYSPNWGMLPTKILYLENGVREREVDIEYERVQDVFVPLRYELRTLIPDGDWKGDLAVHRVVEFETESVNDDIPSSEFELASLKPVDGERLVDIEKKELLVFKNGEFVAQEKASSSSAMLVLIVVNLLVASIVGFLLWRKRRDGSAG